LGVIREGDALTPKLVERALRLLVERDGPCYLTVWNGLTTVQQRVLAAAIHEGGGAMTSGIGDTEVSDHAQYDEQDSQVFGGQTDPAARRAEGFIPLAP
jgi:hypothetical protein